MARRGNDEIPDGAKITVLPRAAEAAAPPVPILFEDEHLIVAEKPAGLITVSARSKGEESLWSSLRRMLKARAKDESIHLVHRLDERASGLLVFAKTEGVKRSLKALFERHTIDRRYAAIVEGTILKDEGEIRSRLVPLDEPMHRVRSITPKDPESLREAAKDAITRYRKRGEGNGVSALEVKLLSGRKHQIRVHFAEAGHPIAGDVLYGAERAERLFLHAWVLGFTHPVTGKPLEFVSSVPRDFRKKVPGAFDAPSRTFPAMAQPLATQPKPPAPSGDARAPKPPSTRTKPSSRNDRRPGGPRKPGRGAR
ncbi:MAG: RluA family pseudouridine synthase [Acidobacteria bacterium]|nr:RluA family pseudouridine synthase [Acidobacteriota bacterium]